MSSDDNAGLRKFVAPEFILGAGSRRLAERYVRNFGARHVFLATDPGVVAAGWAADVAEGLDEAGVPYTLFDGISPNPRASEVMRGAEVYRDAGCDVIVAIGGGSVMDCAKGIGIVTSNGRHVLEFEGIDNVAVPSPPLICIPTTAGTSADVSQFAIITDTDERVKIAIISKAVVPDAALVDPETTVTMDPYLTACTGLDALVHAVEAMVSLANSPVTDLHALEAIRLVRANLLTAIAEPENIEARANMMAGSLHAGLAFSNASLGAVHAMAHSLGGFKDLAHGECNAMLLDHVMAFNYDAAADRYDRMAEAFGVDTRGLTTTERRKALLGAVAGFKAAAGITNGLAMRRVGADDLGILAAKAVVDPCMVTNPRRPDPRDIEVIYGEAL